MLVCHCQAVNDRAIRNCVRKGAKSLQQVTAACGAGKGCGGCHEVIDEIIETDHERPSFRPSLTLIAATG